MIEVIRSDWFSTSWPFLSAKRASGLFWEYSSLTFSLILAKSSSVTLDGSATVTFSVGVAISYFLVCAFNTKVTAPGSVR